jgi:hypothetical protein
MSVERHQLAKTSERTEVDRDRIDHQGRRGCGVSKDVLAELVSVAGIDLATDLHDCCAVFDVWTQPRAIAVDHVFAGISYFRNALVNH